MKTTINKKLETVEDAVIFIQELVRNDEHGTWMMMHLTVMMTKILKL